MATILQTTFEKTLEGIGQVLEYDPAWANGTGYFDHAIRVDLTPGTRAKSIDPAGRRIVMVGTDLGTVVVFERYPLAHDRYLLALNIPTVLRPMFDRTMDVDGIYSHIAHDTINIGTYVHLLKEAFKR